MTKIHHVLKRFTLIFIGTKFISSRLIPRLGRRQILSTECMVSVTFRDLAVIRYSANYNVTAEANFRQNWTSLSSNISTYYLVYENSFMVLLPSCSANICSTNDYKIQTHLNCYTQICNVRNYYELLYFRLLLAVL